MKEKVTSVDPEDILNMDQTPSLFSYHSTRMLERKGSKTVHVWSSTLDTKQVTLAVAIEASKRMLPPMLIFKGAPNVFIVNDEFVPSPKRRHYTCQKNMWMHKEMMNKWRDLILVPWKNSKALGVVSIIILDRYGVHLMGLIIN